MAYWLKITGTARTPFLDGDWAARRSAWLREYGSVSMFPRWPRVADGDVLIDYAAGSHRRFGEARIYAVEEVVSDPVLSPHERWRVMVETSMLVAGPRLGRTGGRRPARFMVGPTDLPAARADRRAE